MGESLGRWTSLVLADDFGNREVTDQITLPYIPPANFQKATADPLEGSAPQETSPSDPPPLEPTENPLPENVQLSDMAEAEAEATFIEWLNTQVIDSELSEKFDPEIFTPKRINTALEILNRYGPEEGIHRLKESDPEIVPYLEHVIAKNRRTSK